MTNAFSVVATVLAVLWTPLVVKFYRAWQARRNPVSLAICWMILVVIYSHLLLTLVLSFQADYHTVSVLALIFSAIACGNFYISFYWSNKKFKDERHH